MAHKNDTYRRVEFCWTPSLQQIAATNLAILVWRQHEVSLNIERMHKPANVFKFFDWSVIEKIVYNKLFQLYLPELLREEVIYVYQPVGEQIQLWLQAIGRLFKDDESLPPFSSWQISWTAEGMVDEQASAEWFLENLQLDLICRYRLACVYCCESYITTLWEQMSELQIKKLRNGSETYTPSMFLYYTLPEDFLVEMAFLKHVAVKPEAEESIEVTSFKGSLCSGYRAATFFFYSKLSNSEQTEVEKWLMQSFENGFKRTTLIDFLIYFLSVVDADMQRKILCANSFAIMKQISFDWRWRHMYQRTVIHLQDFLDGKSFCKLLAQPWLELGINDVVDERYRLAVRELWKRSPTALKKHVLTRGWNLIARLLELRDATSLKLMLSGATAEEREEFASSGVTTKACASLAEMGRVDLIDIFFGAVYSSATDVEASKERLIRNWSVEDITCTTHVAEMAGVLAADLYLDWRFSTEEKALFLKLLFQKDEGLQLFMAILSGGRFSDVLVIRERWFKTEEDFCDFRKAVVRQSGYWWIGNKNAIPAFVSLILMDEKKRGNSGSQNFKNILVHFFEDEDETDLMRKLVGKDFVTRVCSNLIERDDLQLASSFLLWLFQSDADLTKFLSEFFLCPEVIQRCCHFIEVLSEEMPSLSFDPWPLLKKFLCWFRPTREMIVEFRSNMRRELGWLTPHDAAETFMKLLDDPKFLSREVVDVDAGKSEFGDLVDSGVTADFPTPFSRLFSLHHSAVMQRGHQQLDLTFSTADADALCSTNSSDFEGDSWNSNISHDICDDLYLGYSDYDDMYNGHGYHSDPLDF